MKATFFSLMALLILASACSQNRSQSDSDGAGMFKDGDLLLTDANFDQEVVQSAEPVLVDFSATWCPPCRKLSPTVDELAVEYRGRVKVGKVNVDLNPAVTEKYGIKGFPTLLVFKKGEIVDQAIGWQPKEKLAAMLNDALQAK